MSAMLDAAGNPIAYLYDPNGRRTVVTADKISNAMKVAIVSIEDKRFYEHSGVDWRGTARAFFTNSSAGETQQGASTLTQQYVKNYLLLLVVAQNDAERQAATEPTIARKLKEIRISLALDQQLGKQEILTRYLTIVPFGSGAYGIQSAARRTSASTQPLSTCHSRRCWPGWCRAARSPRTPTPRPSWRGATSCWTPCKPMACSMPPTPRTPKQCRWACCPNRRPCPTVVSAPWTRFTDTSPRRRLLPQGTLFGGVSAISQALQDTLTSGLLR